MHRRKRESDGTHRTPMDDEGSPGSIGVTVCIDAELCATEPRRDRLRAGASEDKRMGNESGFKCTAQSIELGLLVCSSDRGVCGIVWVCNGAWYEDDSPSRIVDERDGCSIQR